MKLTTKPFKNGWTEVGIVRSLAIQASLPDGNFSGVLIKAPGTDDLVPNTVPVHIGGWNVTADQNLSTGGFPLAPGESAVFQLSDTDELYIIASSANQLVAWFMQ